MKLELKHLAPYLPYKLRIQYQERNQVMNMGQGHSKHWIGIKSVLRWQDVNGEPPKPLLRPLSDLTKEIEHDGEKFVPADCFWGEYPCSDYFWKESKEIELISFFREDDEKQQAPIMIIESSNMGIVDWSIMQQLFEWHFDVFGLIPEGLAIKK